jgi:TFIIF-interacting CTD phosphatase-like protein
MPNTSQVWVNLRPHLAKFLSFVKKHFEVCVSFSLFHSLVSPVGHHLSLDFRCQVVLFTAGLEEVASKIVDRFDTLKAFSCRYFKSDCKLTPNGYVKDLTKLRPRPLPSIVLVDDNPMACSMQPECFLAIKKWTGQLDDNELQILEKQLEVLLKHCSCPESFSAGLHFLRLHRQYAMSHPNLDEEQWIQVRYVMTFM